MLGEQCLVIVCSHGNSSRVCTTYKRRMQSSSRAKLYDEVAPDIITLLATNLNS